LKFEEDHMTCILIPLHLTDEQKGRICGVLSVGCDWTTASNIVGCSLADIRRAMQHDAEFATSVRRCEAGAELGHMRTVHEAAKDAKNWRASVWWLERRAPDRFGPRRAGVVTQRQLKAYIGILADVVAGEQRSGASRAEILGRLKAFAESVDQLLKNERMLEEEAEVLSGGFDDSDDASAS
jgi:hypothetical protein